MRVVQSGTLGWPPAYRAIPKPVPTFLRNALAGYNSPSFYIQPHPF